MENKKTVSVIGGDTRMLYAAKRIKEHGFDVNICGMELTEIADDEKSAGLDAAILSDILLFGLPFTKDGAHIYAPFATEPIPIREISTMLNEKQTIIAGMLSPAVRAVMESKGARVYDYFTDEPLTLYNALLTAEALTGLLLRKLPCALYDAEIAITGYGRIGFYLARYLRALGANVTVFARNRLQLAKAELSGCIPLPLTDLSERNFTFRALINTVPARIVTGETLQQLNKTCLLVEAASAPYGIDSVAAAAMGFSYLPASGLPGKYAPESAGARIADTAVRLFGEVNKNGPP